MNPRQQEHTTICLNINIYMLNVHTLTVTHAHTHTHTQPHTITILDMPVHQPQLGKGCSKTHAGGQDFQRGRRRVERGGHVELVEWKRG